MRWADGPSLLDRMGLQLPGAFHEATQPDRLLSDVAASAALGFPVAWQSVWHDGKSGEGLTRLGKSVDEVWQAHLQLMTEVWRLAALGCLFGHHAALWCLNISAVVLEHQRCCA